MKFLRMMLAAALCAAALTGCGGSGTGGSAYTTGDADKIAQAGAFSEELESVDGDTAFALYGLADAGLDRAQLTDCAVLRSAGATCEEAARILGVANLRVAADGISKADDQFQALKETLDALPDVTMKKRVRHVVTEIERVRSFVRAFAQGDIEAAGRLFNASHDSLAADYEVTVPELDVAVDVARKNGAYGARMTGGGFGGSIIALVDKGRSQEVAQKIADEFEVRGFHVPRALPAVAAPSASREA